jgi:hypothetical protein
MSLLRKASSREEGSSRRAEESVAELYEHMLFLGDQLLETRRLNNYRSPDAFKSSATNMPAEHMEQVPTHEKEGEFESYFSERPDVIAEVEKEAASSSKELKMKVASLIVRLEVNMWTPLLDTEGDNEHTRALKRLIRCLEKYEYDSPEANAFVASCRDSSTPGKRKYELLDDYEHTIGDSSKVEDALIQLGDSALPLICTQFRRMCLRNAEGEFHYGEEEDYGYSGAWYVKLALASLMSKSGDFRTLPFFVEALLLNRGKLSYHNSWATGMARCLRQYRVPIRVIDECMRKVIGISGSYLLYPRKREWP